MNAEHECIDSLVSNIKARASDDKKPSIASA